MSVILISTIVLNHLFFKLGIIHFVDYRFLFVLLFFIFFIFFVTQLIDIKCFFNITDVLISLNSFICLLNLIF